MENTYEIPKLGTKRLLLKKLDFHDLDDLFEVYSDLQTTTYVLREVHKNKDETRIFLENTIETAKKGKSFIWSIIFKDDQKVIGTCGIWKLSHNSASLGAISNPLYWG
ncbi:GNAT family N-acetyltransferase, partial [Bacillus pseudomycoides]